VASEEQGSANLIPKPVTGLDIRALPIGPAEAFVLSRVDGRARCSEIALATGLSGTQVEMLLLRLASLGAVKYGNATAQSGTSRTPVPRPPAAGTQSGSGTRERFAVAEPPAGPEYDPADLDAPADLDLDRKRLILDTFHRLENYTHYQLLKVPTFAEKKDIKAAYYSVVAVFHPDKYFGKNLGTFKPKLEKIFSRITEAHDTLTRANRREEYDRYLENQRATRALDDVEDDVEAIRREIEREAQMARALRPAAVPSPSPSPSAPASGAPTGRPPPPSNAPTLAPPPPSSPPGATSSTPPAPRRGDAPSMFPPRTTSSIPPAPPGHGAIHSSLPPGSPGSTPPKATTEDRRRALARKLTGSVPPPPLHSQRPSSPPGHATDGAKDALKRLYEARLLQAREERIRTYVEQAEQALAKNNHIAAANALRIAASLAPEDKALTARFQEVDAHVSRVFADQYLQQAQYDERRGHYLEAAQAYERVLRGRPSPQTYDRAAHCLLEARGDLKRAVELARKAVELSPNETAYRITLARLYARAGMDNSALGELERARTLDPSDDTLKDWIKRIKRGEI